MTALLRLGSFVIVKNIAHSPLGSVARGVVLSGDHATRHVLVRSYDESLAGPHLEQHRESLSRRMGRLAGSRGLGSGHELLPAPHLGYAQDYLPGRTLAQVLARAKEEEFELGLELALTLAAGICQALAQAHARGLSRGLLGPDSVWVGFDGSVTLLDACLAGELEGASTIASHGAGGPAPSAWGPGRRDDQALGGMLVGLLTGAPMGSETPDPTTRVEQALKLLTGRHRAPLEIAMRLLGEAPYPSLDEACRDFEEILAHGDFGPTTFTLAFYMHQAFRQETFHDGVEEKDELGMVFKKKELVAQEGMVEPLRGNEGRPRRAFLAAAALLVISCAGGGIAILRSNREKLAQQEVLLRSERQRHEHRLSELARTEAELTARMQALSAQVQSASSAETQARMERELAGHRQAREALLQERKSLARTESARSATMPVAPSGEVAPAPASRPVSAPLASIPEPGPRPSASLAFAANARALEDTEARVVSRGLVPATVWTEARNAVPDLRVVRVRVFVNRNGKGLKTLLDSHPGLPLSLAERFRAAALQCSFLPAQRQGESAAGWVVVDFPSA